MPLSAGSENLSETELQHIILYLIIREELFALLSIAKELKKNNPTVIISHTPPTNQTNYQQHFRKISLLMTLLEIATISVHLNSTLAQEEGKKRPETIAEIPAILTSSISPDFYVLALGTVYYKKEATDPKTLTYAELCFFEKKRTTIIPILWEKTLFSRAFPENLINIIGCNFESISYFLETLPRLLEFLFEINGNEQWETGKQKYLKHLNESRLQLQKDHDSLTNPSPCIPSDQSDNLRKLLSDLEMKSRAIQNIPPAWQLILNESFRRLIKNQMRRLPVNDLASNSHLRTMEWVRENPRLIVNHGSSSEDLKTVILEWLKQATKKPGQIALLTGKKDTGKEQALLWLQHIASKSCFSNPAYSPIPIYIRIENAEDDLNGHLEMALKNSGFDSKQIEILKKCAYILLLLDIQKITNLNFNLYNHNRWDGWILSCVIRCQEGLLNTNRQTITQTFSPANDRQLLPNKFSLWQTPEFRRRLSYHSSDDKKITEKKAVRFTTPVPSGRTSPIPLNTRGSIREQALKNLRQQQHSESFNHFILQLSSLQTTTHKKTCFISYTAPEYPFLNTHLIRFLSLLSLSLQTLKIMPIWDNIALNVGDDLKAFIDRIKTADMVLLICTKNLETKINTLDTNKQQSNIRIEFNHFINRLTQQDPASPRLSAHRIFYDIPTNKDYPTATNPRLKEEEQQQLQRIPCHDVSTTSTENSPNDGYETLPALLISLLEMNPDDQTKANALLTAYQIKYLAQEKATTEEEIRAEILRIRESGRLKERLILINREINLNQAEQGNNQRKQPGSTF